MFIDRKENPQKWLEIWQALTSVLAGEREMAEITEEDITLFCTGYAYEGTDERGHCFTKREKSGRKHYIFIEDK